MNKFDEISLNRFLSSTTNNIPSYPNPQMIPGYNVYYTTNNGPMPPTQFNYSQATQQLDQQQLQQQWNEFVYQQQQHHHPNAIHKTFLQPPLVPIIAGINHRQRQLDFHQDIKSVCLRPGCVKAGLFLFTFDFILGSSLMLFLLVLSTYANIWIPSL